MIAPSEAIEKLIAAGVARVDASPCVPRITLADTIEGQAAELISHLAREEEFSLLLQCYRSGQLSEAQWQEHLKDHRFLAWLYANPHEAMLIKVGEDGQVENIVAPARPNVNPLTAGALANALDAVNNAVIVHAQNHQNDGTPAHPIEVACLIAVAFNAISVQLREGLK